MSDFIFYLLGFIAGAFLMHMDDRRRMRREIESRTSVAFDVGRELGHEEADRANFINQN